MQTGPFFFPLVTFQLCQFPDPACCRDAEIQPVIAWRGRERGQEKHKLGEEEEVIGTLSSCLNFPTRGLLTLCSPATGFV